MRELYQVGEAQLAADRRRPRDAGANGPRPAAPIRHQGSQPRPLEPGGPPTVPAGVLGSPVRRVGHDRGRGRPAPGHVRQRRAAQRACPRTSSPFWRRRAAARPIRDRTGQARYTPTGSSPPCWTTRVPRVAPGGPLWQRFPEPVPLTTPLVKDLYWACGVGPVPHRVAHRPAGETIRGFMRRPAYRSALPAGEPRSCGAGGPGRPRGPRHEPAATKRPGRRSTPRLRGCHGRQK